MAVPYWVIGTQENSAGRPSFLRQIGVKRFSRTVSINEEIYRQKRSFPSLSNSKRWWSVSPVVRNAISRAVRGDIPK